MTSILKRRRGKGAERDDINDPRPRKRLSFASSPCAKGLAAEIFLQDVTSQLQNGGKKETGCLYKLLNHDDHSFYAGKRLVDDLTSRKLTIADLFNQVTTRCQDLNLITKSTTKTEICTMKEILQLWNVINGTYQR